MPFCSRLVLSVLLFVAAVNQTPAQSRTHRKLAAHRVPIQSFSDGYLDQELRAAMARSATASQWPDENFVSLLDTADITVKPDGTTVAEYRLAYKLFNERARDLAEVSLPFNDGYQQVEVLSAQRQLLFPLGDNYTSPSG